MGIKTALVIGYGEVGKAHFEVLEREYEGNVFFKDKGDDIFASSTNPVPVKNLPPIDLMLIATQCDPDNMLPFYEMVSGYEEKFYPKYIDILTTTPCGATEELDEKWCGAPVVKSTIRGMHPHLAKFLIDIPKHIGGRPEAVAEITKFYENAGITCYKHGKSRATELFHALNNFIYGVNILAADECAKYCREFGVDYMEFLEYRKTNNEGFIRAGYPSKVSPILTPLNGNGVLGHCVTYSATTIPEMRRGPLAKLLAGYNKLLGLANKVDKNA